MEPAAALIRHLFESYLEVAWMIGYDLPDNREFSVEMSDPYALSETVAPPSP